MPRALGLGPVEGEIGILEQLVGIGAVARRDGDADAGADRDLMAAELEGLADRLDDAGCERRGGDRLLGRDLHDGRTRRRRAVATVSPSSTQR